MGRVSESMNLASDEAHNAFLKQELESALKECPLFKSGDVAIFENAKIPALGSRSAVFLLSPEQIPLLESVPVEALSLLGISVRSRLAQGGFDIGDRSGTQAFGHTKPGGYVYDKNLKGYLVRMPVENRSQRPLLITAGTPVFRYYNFKEQNRVVGDELETLVEQNSEDLNIEGEVELSKYRDSIVIPINPNTLRAVNPSFGSEHEIKQDCERRAAVDPVLNPLTPSPFPQLIVGETKHVTIKGDYEGVIGTTTKLGFRQSNSVLMDKDVTDHTIRTEVGMRIGNEQVKNPPQDAIFLSLFKYS